MKACTSAKLLISPTENAHRAGGLGVNAVLEVQVGDTLFVFGAREARGEFVAGDIQRHFARARVAEEAHADGDAAPVGFLFQQVFFRSAYPRHRRN